MSTTPPHTLPPRTAYRLWATTYECENPVTALDETAVGRLTPSIAGRRLLDAGCGTGRRTPEVGTAGPELSVGVDFVREMLRATRHERRTATFACADVRALPFAPRIFDTIWCRLAIGHIAVLDHVYGELSRVLQPDGVLIVTDFHPECIRAGYARTFRDSTGKRWAVEHHTHQFADHKRAAAAVGLTIDDTVSLAVGPDVKTFYERSNLLEAYQEQLGLPVLLSIRFKG